MIEKTSIIRRKFLIPTSLVNTFFTSEKKKTMHIIAEMAIKSWSIIEVPLYMRK